jgi:uncharacterized membrane protein
MHPYELHYFPHPPLYYLLFFLLLGFVFLLLVFHLIDYAYERLGLSHRAAITILFASLLGSAINIPVAELPAHQVVRAQVVQLFGMQYVVPHVVNQQQTIIAVNVGGAVIPVLLCTYLMLRHGISRQLLLALAVVTLLVHLLARPVAGVGITLPPLMPSLTAAGAALLLDRRAAPRTAYVSGTLGTLIGADILNLGTVQALHAPVASIGGAGTFDGVFLTGIIAVLLAGFAWSGPPAPRETPR